MAHPGHELRVLDWVAHARPMACILTDGSGSEGVPRIGLTQRSFEQCGIQAGPILGEMSDRQMYAYLLAQDASIFFSIRDRLCDWLVDNRIDVLVSDGMEGYNPTHDLCHALASAAVGQARIRGVAVAHWCIPLIGDPRRFADGASPIVHESVLDAGALARKMAAIRAYAADSGSTLQSEVDQIIRMYGADAFGHERFFDAAAPSWLEWRAGFRAEKPYYERYGRAQVAAGRYDHVISFDDQVGPLIDTLFGAECAPAAAGAAA
ncbi:MAG TPA: hypothetical protein VF132_04945 [Rudaea sp.]